MIEFKASKLLEDMIPLEALVTQLMKRSLPEKHHDKIGIFVFCYIEGYKRAIITLKEIENAKEL